MRKFWYGGAVVGLAILGAVAPLRAQSTNTGSQQNNIPFGTKSGEFLLIPVGGRGTALGSAFTALSDDISSMYWNPAGLALIPGAGVEVSRINYIADTKFTWVGGAIPFSGGERAIGFSLTSFGFSDQPIYTVESPDGTGRSYSVAMTALGLTLAQQFTDRFSFGITGKLVSEDLGGPKASTITADFGTSYHTKLGGRPIRGAFVITNLAGSLQHSGAQLDTMINSTDPTLPPEQSQSRLSTKSFELPTMFHVGIAYDLLSSASQHFTAAGEFLQPSNADISGAVGAEYALEKIGGTGFGAALRGGWNLATDNGLDLTGSKDNGAQNDGMSFGVGLKYQLKSSRNFGFDYAYRNMGLLGNQNLFSLYVHW